MRVMNQDFKQKLLNTLTLVFISAAFSTVGFAEGETTEAKAAVGKDKPKCEHCTKKDKKSKKDKKCKCSEDDCKDGKCKHDKMHADHAGHADKKVEEKTEDKK